MGGLSLFVTSMIYLAAAFKGEQWKPVGLEEKPAEDLTKKDLKSFRQPKKPPPRAPPQEVHDNRVWTMSATPGDTWQRIPEVYPRG